MSQLVPRFDVNSPQDLERLTAETLEHARDYVDLELDYLPVGVGVGVGSALRAVVPVVRNNDPPNISIVLPASQPRPRC